MKPDVITIELTATQGFRVQWQRMAAEQLFIGLPPARIYPLIPSLFSLCSQAHGLAARLALSAAAGHLREADPEELDTLTLEAVRDTLRKVLLDWSLAFEGAPADPALLEQWRLAQNLPAMAALAEEQVYGMAPATWLGLGLNGWQQWMASARVPVARWLNSLKEADAGCLLLPILNARMLSTLPLAWFDSGSPEWQGMPCEVGALAREAELLAPLMHAGQLTRARLLARLIQLARWLDGARLAVDWAPCHGGAVALVDTARGLLLHHVVLDDAGRVAQYRIQPPTAWHTHPQGLIANTLNARRQASEAEWRRQVALIDPCVAYEMRCQNSQRFHIG
ncbi:MULTISPECIES: hypothetical protein [unclassified Paludibacterium]|uniref:hypothetical protein n=1 Tax=unclassified Paludibacterium TaxID=2618429 RepID=UPI001C05005E|nr:hypothetical protein [Paludibacterium sp. B53371]BEV71637.1 nickel-dependent hydrogenase large subunit [Paludibacterium sp. THUN1379]